MIQMNPYLSFDGDCREAMTFYKECFGGELTMHIVEGSPLAEHMPPDASQRILHCSLESGNMIIMASDMVGPEGHHKGNTISLHVVCSSETEIDSYYAQLSEGGTIICPLGPSFFSARFATVTDKFGITWVLNYEVKPEY